MYDIVFISYQEPNADDNYSRLKSRFAFAKRVHGVKGIHHAHIAAASLCNTNMFWVVDGDAIIVDEFDFSYKTKTQDTVYVWRSKNAVNGLVYGNGGVKLLPRKMTINMDLSKPDMTTSISEKFKPILELSNINSFNTDPYNTWKSAFRECCKLSSKVIDRQKTDETNERLDVWCNVASGEYSEYSITGANAGKKYGLDNAGNLQALKKINDFEWLKEQFTNGTK